MTNRELAAQALRQLRPHVRVLAVALLCSAAGAIAFGAGEPLLQKRMLDSLAGRRLEAFVIAALLFVALDTCSKALTYFAATWSQRLKNDVGRDQTLRIFGVFYTLPYAEVARHDQAYFVSRVYDEPSAVAADLVNTVTALVTAVVMFVAAAAIALWLSWKVAVVVTMVVPFLLSLSTRFGSRITEATKRASEEEAVMREGLGRALAAYKTVALFDLYTRVRANVTDLLDKYLATAYHQTRYNAGFQATSNVFLAYAELVVMLGAGVQVIRGAMTIGGLFAFMGAYWRVIAAANMIVAKLPTLAKLKGQVARAAEIEAVRPRRSSPSDAILQMAHVGFRYNDEPLICDFSLCVGPRDRVVVTGPNGSGKTTLAHLLTGFLEAAEGEQHVPPLKRMSALLLPFAFIPGVVRDNVGFDSLSDTKRELFFRLARQFRLEGKLGQDPATLSQGEQRKLQVIMAVLKDADYYVFDEPLSNVDEDSKDAVMNAIISATQDRALVVVMHGEDKYRAAFSKAICLTDARPEPDYNEVGPPSADPTWKPS